MLRVYALLRMKDPVYDVLLRLVELTGIEVAMLRPDAPAPSCHHVLVPFPPPGVCELADYARHLRRIWEHRNRFVLLHAATWDPTDRGCAVRYGLDLASTLGELLRVVSEHPPLLPDWLVRQLVEDDIKIRCRRLAHDLRGSDGSGDSLSEAQAGLAEAVAAGLWKGPSPKDAAHLAEILSLIGRRNS